MESGGRVDECVVQCWSNEPQSKSSKTKETVVDCLRSRPLRQPFPNDDDEDDEEERGSGPEYLRLQLDDKLD